MSYNNNYLITCIILIFITTVFLLNNIPIAFSIDEDTELGYKCLSSNEPFNSIYNQTLETVMNNLITNTATVPFRGGYSAAIKKGDDYNWVYGHAMCRGDVSADECQACIENAANTLIDTTHCPNNRSAIVWRNYCMVKYSDVDFLGKIDTDDNITMYNSTGLNWGYNTVEKFFRNLTQVANKSPMKFAHGSMEEYELGSLYQLYGMVQCTLDLILRPDDCVTCLNLAIEGLSKCCDTKQDGRIVYGSCNVRFEMYNFLKS
ncbi:hypothetical protein CASFOL_040844 [Castilleja foliolosa]|uniref:Gnk2-homologous domain-containing protein n=1 Tax=Castilleja foliolosa TaxID=1961234 RepID=A0ABD3BDA5_9LAMI